MVICISPALHPTRFPRRAGRRRSLLAHIYCRARCHPRRYCGAYMLQAWSRAARRAARVEDNATRAPQESSPVALSMQGWPEMHADKALPLSRHKKPPIACCLLFMFHTHFLQGSSLKAYFYIYLKVPPFVKRIDV
jgi:hypothetical protein